MSRDPLEQRLTDAEQVRAVRDALADAPVEAWLVGGVVRDALVGRPLGDVDVVVDGDPQLAARAVARAVCGPAFPLSEEFGAWRTIDRRQGFSYDVAPLQGQTIEQDLRRRDFTVNAVAVPLQGGPPIDPANGIGDL